MDIRINYSSGEPICRQVCDQIKLAVVSGRLQAGEKMPSIRDLAQSLKVNPTTVVRIYNELAHEGIVTVRQGQGAFIAEGAPQRLSPQEVQRVVGELARKMLIEGLRMGMSLTEIIKTVRAQYGEIEAARPNPTERSQKSA